MKILLFLFALSINGLVRAQFSDSVTHLARLGAAGNLNRSNNASSYLFSTDARYSVRNKQQTLNTSATWLYGEQGNNLTNNDFISSADLNFYHDSSRLYYWALANYTASYSLRIRHQLQSGAGLAFNFLNKGSAWLNLSDGLLYETSSLTTKDLRTDGYQTFRNSLRLSHRFQVGKFITISGANYLQHALGNGSDYILRINNSAAIKLNKWVSFTTTVSFNQYRRTGSEAFLFTYGLVAERYF